jgi:hypothetical protein
MEICTTTNDAGDVIHVLTRSGDVYREGDLNQFQIVVSDDLAADNDFMRCIESKIDDWLGDDASLLEACGSTKTAEPNNS